MPVNATNDKLGWLAPSFNLLDISDNYVSLDQLKGDNGTVIAFICNHCPYVIAIAERLSFEAKELKKLSINMIAIMSNDAEQYPEDSFENMKSFAKKYDFSEICITSHANTILDENAKDNIEVKTSKANGKKCSICWKIRETECERHPTCSFK